MILQALDFCSLCLSKISKCLSGCGLSFLADACFSYDVPCHLAFDSAFACRVGAREPGAAPSNRHASKVLRKTSEIDLRRPPLVDLSLKPLARLASFTNSGRAAS